MTVKEFRDQIEVRRDFDFIYNNTHYMINATRGKNGNLEIDFGEEFTAKQHFDSITHLLSDGKIGIKNLQEVLCDIN